MHNSMNARRSIILAAFLALAGLAGAALAASPQGDGPWMLRVSPLEPARLAELTGADHMKLYREKGFALLFADPPALERLLAAGFEVEVDVERTALLAGAIAPVGARVHI